MRVAVIGGGLQGVETAYLARKAGWHVDLVDRRSAPPARDLAQRFYQMDVSRDPLAKQIFDGVDLVLPALENQSALDALVRLAQGAAAPLAFDAQAYAVTRSKKASNELFARLDLPLPAGPGRQTGPVIVKPSSGSGSRQVRKFATLDAAQAFMAGEPAGGSWVCQNYLAGPTYSIEVLGRPGDYRTFAVTDLFMDEAFDCQRVRAPSILSAGLQRALARMALCLAEALSLEGLMDVEAVLHGGRLYLLEIDARIPSQTPTAVYWATGVNMIAQLGRLFAGGGGRNVSAAGRRHAVVYEHVRVSAGTARTCGEHAMARSGPLHLTSGFFGSDEAITDFRSDCGEWAATLIFAAGDSFTAWRKRCAALVRIRSAAGHPPGPGLTGDTRDTFADR